MSDGFKQLDDESEYKDAVLSFDPSRYSMLRVGEFVANLYQAFRESNLLEKFNIILSYKQRGQISENWQNLLTSELGYNCEILRSGSTKGWQKGKIRIKISLEFCPDEPEIEETPVSEQTENIEPKSPLDDLRRQLNLDNQK